MKRMNIEKAVDTATLTPEQLERINRYSRRSLEEEEVFAFSVILCDNEIDRDMEQFPRDSLEKLAELFLGRTGVFDHAPKAENQSARIFETRVVGEGKKNSLGEDYCCLKAWAYMARCERNQDLILEIDAGIKKEVSVGCAVERIVCSVCGADQKEGGCAHKKGRTYAGVRCWHLLEHPTDAYEWSFVAVPAQKNAGVTKGWRENPTAFDGEVTLSKLFEHRGDVLLTQAQVESLARQHTALKAAARAGEEYLEELRREVIKVTLLAQPDLDPQVMERLAQTMDTGQLRAFRKSFGAAAAKALPLGPQLGRPVAGEQNKSDSSYKI